MLAKELHGFLKKQEKHAARSRNSGLLGKKK